jgi:hypothetical protein
MKKRYIVLALLLFATCLWPKPAPAQFDISLSPLLVQLDMAPGSRKMFSVFVNNENDQRTVNLIVYSMDMIETEQGAYKVVDKGQSEFSCADWMRIQDTSFALAPNASKEIKVQIMAPPNVFGGRYGAVVVEVVPEAAPSGQKLGSVQYHFRMPAFVELSVKRFGGLARKASISDFKVERVTRASMIRELGGPGLGFTASVKNEGNVHVEGTGSLIIKDQNGRTKRRVPLGGGRGIVIPGATVEFQSFLKEPPVGQYVARAVVSFGGLSPCIAEVPFVVSRTKGSASGAFKASAAMAMQVQPEKLDLKIPNRGLRAATFSFRNQEQDTIFVRAHVAELGLGLDGDVQALDSAETGRSCKPWIGLDPVTFSVAPERSAQVRFTIKAPEEGEGGYYACLVFDALLKESNQNVISTPFEIPVLMSIPPKQTYGGEVLDMEIEATAGKPGVLTAYFKNLGNIHVKPKGRVTISKFKAAPQTADLTYVGKTGYEKVVDFAFEDVDQYVLPQGVRKMVAAYAGALDRGKYQAEISITYGGAEPAKLVREFQIK